MKNWVIVSLAGGIMSALAVSLGSFGTYPSEACARTNFYTEDLKKFAAVHGLIFQTKTRKKKQRRWLP